MDTYKPPYNIHYYNFMLFATDEIGILSVRPQLIYTCSMYPEGTSTIIYVHVAKHNKAYGFLEGPDGALILRLFFGEAS